MAGDRWGSLGDGGKVLEYIRETIELQYQCTGTQVEVPPQRELRGTRQVRRARESAHLALRLQC